MGTAGCGPSAPPRSNPLGPVLTGNGVADRIGLLLVDHQALTRQSLANRLRALGFEVTEAAGLDSASPHYSECSIALAAYDFHNPDGIRLVEEYALYNPAGRAATITHAESVSAFAETVNPDLAVGRSAWRAVMSA
jgi:DNA-binding NtrC family response regulator